jgi:hypothetical protein
VNRVRETERGWDALNENFNSPVHGFVAGPSLYAFLSEKTALHSTVKISGPPDVTCTVCSNWAMLPPSRHRKTW